MTNSTAIHTSATSLWKRLFAAAKTLDDALEYDPAERAIDLLSREVETLKASVHALEERSSK